MRVRHLLENEWENQKPDPDIDKEERFFIKQLLSVLTHMQRDITRIYSPNNAFSAAGILLVRIDGSINDLRYLLHRTGRRLYDFDKDFDIGRFMVLTRNELAKFGTNEERAIWDKYRPKFKALKRKSLEFQNRQWGV